MDPLLHVRIGHERRRSVFPRSPVLARAISMIRLGGLETLCCAICAQVLRRRPVTDHVVSLVHKELLTRCHLSIRLFLILIEDTDCQMRIPMPRPCDIEKFQSTEFPGNFYNAEPANTGFKRQCSSAHPPDGGWHRWVNPSLPADKTPVTTLHIPSGYGVSRQPHTDLSCTATSGSCIRVSPPPGAPTSLV